MVHGCWEQRPLHIPAQNPILLIYTHHRKSRKLVGCNSLILIFGANSKGTIPRMCFVPCGFLQCPNIVLESGTTSRRGPRPICWTHITAFPPSACVVAVQTLRAVRNRTQINTWGHASPHSGFFLSKCGKGDFCSPNLWCYYHRIDRYPKTETETKIRKGYGIIVGCDDLISHVYIEDVKPELGHQKRSNH